ncbi:MAG: ATP-binding protein [Dongiaceae bacterium]
MIKQWLPHSLLTRALLIIVTPLLLLQIITSYVFYDRHWETMVRRLSSDLAGDISLTTSLIEKAKDKAERDRILTQAGTDFRLDIRLLPNENLPPKRRKTNTLAEDALSQELSERIKFPFTLTQRKDNSVVIRVDVTPGILEFTAGSKRLYSSTTFIVLGWMIGTSIIVFGLAALFMRNQVRPIRNLAIAAENFGKGFDITDFKPSGAAEVRRAAIAFRVMRDRLRRAVQQRTAMLAGVSHDLRTPLTRLKLQLAMLPPSPDTAGLQADIEEMERMIDAYLAFARDEEEEAPVAVELSRFLNDMMQDFQREGYYPQLGEVPDIAVTWRLDAMRRCLSNLIGNACRYGNEVVVSAYANANAIEIHIDDDGPGIPADLREEVFKPFRRLEESRNPETGGVGLGLSIARDIARRHGGDITLHDSPLGGLRAVLRLPL